MFTSFDHWESLACLCRAVASVAALLADVGPDPVAAPARGGEADAPARRKANRRRFDWAALPERVEAGC
jgi:hypothetical protein